MCFLENNRYYIQHSLYHAIKNLSDKERHEYYVSIKPEIRQRLKYSSQNCVNKSRFYLEAFEVLAEYEADYLILNIFYETDSATIINYLSSAKIFQKLKLKDSNSFTAKYLLHIVSTLELKGEYKEINERDFLKTCLLNTINTINARDWDLEKENNSAILLKYSRWIFNKVKEEINIEEVYSSLLLFAKIWNYFDFINSPFNKRAILLYSFVISEHEKIADPFVLVNIHKCFIRAKNSLLNLFVKIKYIPLLDNEDSAVYKPGYLIKRELFLNKLRDSEKLISISKNSSFLSLFKSTQMSDNEMYYNSAKSALQKKIENFELPDSVELNKIYNLELKANADLLRDYLFEKLYLFEFI